MTFLYQRCLYLMTKIIQVWLHQQDKGLTCNGLKSQTIPTITLSAYNSLFFPLAFQRTKRSIILIGQIFLPEAIKTTKLSRCDELLLFQSRIFDLSLLRILKIDCRKLRTSSLISSQPHCVVHNLSYAISHPPFTANTVLVLQTPLINFLFSEKNYL